MWLFVLQYQLAWFEILSIHHYFYVRTRTSVFNLKGKQKPGYFQNKCVFHPGFGNVYMGTLKDACIFRKHKLFCKYETHILIKYLLLLNNVSNLRNSNAILAVIPAVLWHIMISYPPLLFLLFFCSSYFSYISYFSCAGSPPTMWLIIHVYWYSPIQ